MYKKVGLILSIVILFSGCAEMNRLGTAMLDGAKKGWTGEPLSKQNKSTTNSSKKVKVAKQNISTINSSKKVDIDISDARRYFDAKNYRSAIKYASSACNQKSGSACTLMGQAYVNLNQMDKAVELFDKACGLNDYRGCFSIATYYYLKDSKKANLKAKKYALKSCSQEEDSESAYLSCSMVAQIEQVDPANSRGGIIQPLSYLPYYHASCVAGKKAKEEGKTTYIKPSEYQKICEYSKKFLELGSGGNNKNVTPKQSYTGTSSSSSGGCYMKTVCRPGVYPCQQVQTRICD